MTKKRAKQIIRLLELIHAELVCRRAGPPPAVIPFMQPSQDPHLPPYKVWNTTQSNMESKDFSYKTYAEIKEAGDDPYDPKYLLGVSGDKKIYSWEPHDVTGPK